MAPSVSPSGISGNRTFKSAVVIAILLTSMPALRSQEEDAVRSRRTAMALEQKGENAEAERIWSAILAADPRNAEALAHLGLLEARQEHLDTAIDYYRKAAAVDPDLPGLEMNLGLALFKAAQFPDAIKSFSSEIRKHPGDQRLTILLGMAHYGMKDYLVAIPYLHRAAERDPQNTALRLALARSCLWSKQYKCVIDAHREILSLNAESAEADMLAGEALDAIEDTANAIRQFQAAIRLNPKEQNVHFGLGYLFWTRKQLAEASDEFQHELENNPRDMKSRVYLADAWVRQGEIAKAAPLLRDLVESDPTQPLVHFDLGRISAEAGRKDEAIQEFKLAMKYDPEDKEAELEIARLSGSSGRTERTALERGLPQREHPPLVEVIGRPEASAP